MTQSDNKIKGKFYPLQHEEWLHSINQLTHAELKVLYYLRSLDPYNNGIDLTPAQIAKDLSTPEHPVHRSTVGRALKSLDTKSFINLELIQVQVKVNPKGFHVATSQQSCDDTTQVATPQHKLSPRNTSCDTATQVATPQHPPSETLSEQESQISKIYKTYKDFKDSLSQDEREKFLKFVRGKIKDFQRPINDVEGWLASENQAGINRWQAYYPKFQKEVGEAIASSQSWENHPKYQEWLNLLQTKGMAFYKVDELDYGDGEIVHFGTSEDRDEREAFANWAKANNKMDFNGRRQLSRQVLIGEGEL